MIAKLGNAYRKCINLKFKRRSRKRKVPLNLKKIKINTTNKAKSFWEILKG